MAKQITCPTQLIHPDAKAPARGSAKAAGHDICCVAGVHAINPDKWDGDQRAEWSAMEERGYVDLYPGQGFLFRTGFMQAIATDHVCVFWDRSSMGGKKMVHRLAGVIDEDYRGEWFVRLVNHSDDLIRVKVGDKIVQGVYQERIEAECPVVDSLEETERGDGGFGSTDQPPQPSVQPAPQVVQVADAVEPLTPAAAPIAPEVDADVEITTDRSSDAAGLTFEDADPASFDGGPTREDLNPLAPVSLTAQDVVEEVPEEAPPAPEGFTYGPVTVYDGNSAGNALSCMRDRQYAAAIDWITRDREFYPNGAPEIAPETLRTVAGRIAVAYNPLVPFTEDES